MIAAVQEHSALKPGGLQEMNSAGGLLQRVVYAGLGPGLVCRVSGRKEGDSPGGSIQTAAGSVFPQRRLEIRFQEANIAILREVAVVKSQRPLAMPLVTAIAPPIRRDNIQPAVTVEIPNAHAIPPADQLVES